MYPKWLINSMMFVSGDSATSWIRAEGDGAFAFIKKFKKVKDAQGNKPAKSWAMRNANGNTHLARQMLVTENDSELDVLFQETGKIWSVSIQTRHLGRFSTVERFIADFNANVGANLNRDKFLYPGKMYETVM